MKAAITPILETCLYCFMARTLAFTETDARHTLKDSKLLLEKKKEIKIKTSLKDLKRSFRATVTAMSVLVS